MQKDKNGFSLIEGLMAIAILSIGILAVVTLFSQSATQSRSTASRITALGLVQEGAELVRVLRNDDLVQGNDIFYKIGSTNNKCRVRTGDNPSSALAVGFECNNGYNNSHLILEVDDRYSDYYQYGVPGGHVNGEFPSFWRRIYVSDPGGAISQREIASVVFYREPTDLDWPNDMNEIEGKCITQKSCVFAKILLQ